MKNRRRGARDTPNIEGYQGSISDMMTGMVFLFIITLAIFVLHFHTAETNAVNEALNEASQVQSTARENLLNELEKELAGEGLKVEIVRNQGILRLTQAQLIFASGNDVLTGEDTKENLGKVAHVLARVLPRYVRGYAKEKGGSHPSESNEPTEYCQQPAVEISNFQETKRDGPSGTVFLETLLIEGHTDAEPIGEALREQNRIKDNLQLSAMRARSIHEEMLNCEGVLARLRNQNGEPILSVSGYGETRSLNPSEPQDYDKEDVFSKQDRRIDLRFLMSAPQIDRQDTDRQDVVREVEGALES